MGAPSMIIAIAVTLVTAIFLISTSMEGPFDEDNL
jgi:hypothetical protein